MRLNAETTNVRIDMPIDFSVVIPTFRRPKQLEEAIASVLGQTGVTVEIIVVDDSPEGSARAVVEGVVDRRVQYLKNPAPTGGSPSAVRNLGWPIAQGAFIHFLDDDDIVPRGHYAAVKKIFVDHTEVGAVFGRIEPFGNGPEEQLRHEREFFGRAAQRARACSRFGHKWGFAACMMFRRTLLITSAGVVRRECVQRIGGFDPQIRIGEDVDFYARIFRQRGGYFMDSVSLKFRVGHPSIMHSPPPGKTEAELQCEAREQLYAARRRTHARYRREWGSLEFYLLKAFAHGVLRFL
jgi:glycosyltransferase involved in cell wall biosynthesis